MFVGVVWFWGTAAGKATKTRVMSCIQYLGRVWNIFDKTDAQVKALGGEVEPGSA